MNFFKHFFFFIFLISSNAVFAAPVDFCIPGYVPSITIDVGDNDTMEDVCLKLELTFYGILKASEIVGFSIFSDEYPLVGTIKFDQPDVIGNKKTCFLSHFYSLEGKICIHCLINIEKSTSLLNFYYNLIVTDGRTG